MSKLTTKEMVMTRTHKCKVCDMEYTRQEVVRKYGVDFPFGYCCPRCYTADKIEKGEGIE